MREKQTHWLSKSTIAMMIITAVMAALNIIARASSDFTDFYADNIYAPSARFFAAVTGLIPFSFGELLIAVGILLVVAALVLFPLFIMLKKRKFVKRLGKFYCWVLVYIFVTETLNCFMLYNTTDFSERYHQGAGSEGFTVAELSALCEETILAANELSLVVNRDSEGIMTVPDDMSELAEISMNKIAEDYPQLKGYYPPPKKIVCSMLMTQLDLQGIFFPFTLEANYNARLCPARVPCTVMHELSHVKGFIKEDEACFIAYRACIESDSPELRYSGYLSALNYLFNETAKYASDEEIARLSGLISSQVRNDNRFVSEEYKEEIAQKAVLPTEAVSAASEIAMDTTLKIGGVSDGKKSYGRMVSLLLEYHYCIEE